MIYDLQPLLDAGLIIHATASDDPPIKNKYLAAQYRIMRPAPPGVKPSIIFDTQPVVDSITNLDFPLRQPKWLRDYAVPHGMWVFWYWGYMPGPGITDFAALFSTLNESVPVVIDFYFGSPTLLEEWLAPFHRHPELDRTAVQRAITQAQPTTSDALKALRKQYHEQLPPRGWEERPWHYAMRTQFIPIPHQHDSTRVLHLRRDCQEAYTVQQ